jgi:drug/metabolite transporter (DMT)-like permease
MIGLIFAFLSSITESLKDVITKINVKKIDEYITAWSLKLFALIVITPFMLYFGVPKINNLFWYAALISGTLVSITTVIYTKALKLSPISLTMPMINFTPVFLLITSPLILNEFPDSYGLIGVLLIVVGSYMLNIKNLKKNFLYPLKSLFKEQGSKLMLFAAFIFSIVSNVDKIGIKNSTPIFFVFASTMVSAIILTLIVLIKSRKNINQIPKNVKKLSILGMISGISNILIFIAYSITLVIYALSIRRLSTLFSTLYGGMFFKEKDVKWRFLGVCTMILGVIFITLL